jgi:CRISPR system Cascade subunit CasA
METRFNLLDEPWVPISGVGNVGLVEVFSNPEFRFFGGSPVERISLLKFVLAIAQAASTPQNEAGWLEKGSDGLARECVNYLEKYRDRFFLYGPQPFLQIPAIAEAKIQEFGAVLPEVATGNTTVLSQTQVQRGLADHEKALLLVGLMSLALSGKKTDNRVVLTPGYGGKANARGKPSTGKPGPGVGHLGHLHNFLVAPNLLQTIWLNLLTSELIEKTGMFPKGVGKAPWEKMPTGEDCPVAKALKESYLGRLVPISRFCLLSGNGLHYSEGIAHSGYKEGVWDPSIAVDLSGRAPKSLWADPEKRPWRELTSVLAFLENEDSRGFQCIQLEQSIPRARQHLPHLAIWSGGLRVSSNAGEQYVSGSDDYVESTIWLTSAWLGQAWFAQFKQEMEALNGLANGLYGRVVGYYREQKVDAKSGGKVAAQATHMFWQQCERRAQELADACGSTVGNISIRQLRKHFAAVSLAAYDHHCPRETARQLDAWANCRPDHRNYIKQEV